MSYGDNQRRYVAGRTPLTARRLNQLGERFTRLERDARTVDLTGRPRGIPKKVAQRMRLKSVGYDYITCRTLDEDGNEGDEDIIVAKPEELQRTPWDGKTIAGVAYTISGVQARNATQSSPAANETQVVIPTYQVAVTNYDGSVIFAVKPYGGTGVVDGDGVPVEWQDLNVAGRAWAKVSA